MGCHAGPGNNSTGSQESILRGFPLAKGATIETTEIRTYLTVVVVSAGVFGVRRQLLIIRC